MKRFRIGKSAGIAVAAVAIAAALLFCGFYFSGNAGHVSEERDTAAKDTTEEDAAEEGSAEEDTTTEGTSAEDAAAVHPTIKILLEKDGISETILPQWDGECYRLYLPSFAGGASPEIIADSTVYIDDVPAADAEDLLRDGTHVLKSAVKEYDLNVYTSANVGTVFIRTESGSMEDIYADPTDKESMEMVVVADDGTLNYRNSGDRIGLRGNSTMSPAKKPFNLKLTDAESVLGLCASTGFALLANGFDRSGLRDVIYKGLAEDMDFSRSPGTEYVDVYLNGEYNGLYVLSEKISGSGTGLIPDDGSFLCSIELLKNMKEGDIYVDSVLQEIFEIYDPKDPSEAEKEKIKEKLAAFERALAAPDGTDSESGKSWDEMIDMESWAKGYVIDEVTANTDSCLASSFIYYNASDGLLYKGPVWDGDRILGNQSSNQDPRTLMASQGHGYDGKTTAYYTYLLQREEFRNRVKEIYVGYDFEQLLNDLIDLNCEKTETAKELDNIRWSSLYDSSEINLGTSVISAQDLKAYVHERVDYLNEVIPHLEDYAVIYICDAGIHYQYATVQKGDVFTPADTSAEYVDMETGEYVDFTKPVYENLSVRIEK